MDANSSGLSSVGRAAVNSMPDIVAWPCRRKKASTRAGRVFRMAFAASASRVGMLSDSGQSDVGASAAAILRQASLKTPSGAVQRRKTKVPKMSNKHASGEALRPRARSMTALNKCILGFPTDAL